MTEREILAQCWAQGLSQAAITRRLDRHPSTIRREQTQKSIRAVLNVADQDDDFMTDELKRLNGELKSLDKGIRDLEAQAARGAPVELNRVGEALRAIDPIWDALFPEEQRRIAQLLVEEITVSTSGIDTRFRTNGIEQIVEELQPIEERHVEQHA